jgi:hypothetical protein
MKSSKTGLGLLATIAILAVPAAAHAEYLVPPGNSAATQYTEAVPTAGGPKASNSPKHGGDKSPKQVLGHRNAEKLDAQGAEGREAAVVVAATAPDTVGSAGGGSGHDEPGSPESQQGSGAGHASGGGGSEGGGAPADGSGQPNSHDTVLVAQQTPSGSSGLGEVLGQATGSSDSGQLGLLLPLIVLGAIAWSVAYVLRRRKQPTQ